jgi:hypothetical protein
LIQSYPCFCCCQDPTHADPQALLMSIVSDFPARYEVLYSLCVT